MSNPKELKEIVQSIINKYLGSRVETISSLYIKQDSMGLDSEGSPLKLTLQVIARRHLKQAFLSIDAAICKKVQLNMRLPQSFYFFVA